MTGQSFRPNDSASECNGSAGDGVIETQGVYSEENYSNQVRSKRQMQQWYKQLTNRGKAGYSEADECDSNWLWRDMLFGQRK